ncbi:MAG: phosphoenolpyruvate carboxykinase (GTP) [Gammaproteobacteria bacterium]|nr:phosphoenolpyruvate carboxykinase (GTP) [Gammaproteobacteria bacterium]
MAANQSNQAEKSAINTMTTSNQALKQWVSDVAALTRPQSIVWCDGSDQEYDDLIKQMVSDGTLKPLNDETHPDCYLHLSDPQDVARVEHLTFICTVNQQDAGDNNHWMAVNEAKQKMNALYDGCMEGRTMYVIPYCMGPVDSPYSRCGVEITDSPYVVINMNLMTRMGADALARIERDDTFVRGLHSTGELDPERRYIMHFPEELSIMSFGSGYGGNALLGKKCHALRIASWQARQEGWLAEHMLILGLESPTGETHYIAAAFPSACGKTNLAMLIPPEKFKDWKIWTLGDDIAWLHLDAEGQMRAINPEAGYFGVVPGTNEKTNRNAYDMIQRNTIFTNVGQTEDQQPWWEGKKDGTPVMDWKGQPMAGDGGPAAHPNSRFTVSATQNKAYSSLAEAPQGVPISAIVFGGRRRELAPLVYQAKSWEHGVLIGAGVASETTAAATGEVGVVRRDPMAMKPFCGYNFADYWSHWLSFSGRSDKLPKIFHVNWFRQDQDGNFLWPGFGENLRVLQWITQRCDNKVSARETAIGYLPNDDDLDIDDLQIDPQVWQSLLSVDREQWRQELDEFGQYLDSFGDRLPGELRHQHQQVRAALD